MSPSTGHDITLPINNQFIDESPNSKSDVPTPPVSPTSTSGGKPLLSINCILLGDEKIGKSSIASTYISPGGGFPQSYEPTTREEYNVERQLNDGFGQKQSVALKIVDTGGQKDLDRLRPLCYNQANVFILCFSVVVPSSFQSLMTKWIPEIKRHTNYHKISLFLIGTQSDLRSNTTVLLKLSKDGKSPISESRAIRLGGKIGAKNYIECSALTQKNVRQIFDYVMINSMRESRSNTEDNTVIDSEVAGQRQTGIPRIPYSNDNENKAYIGKKGRKLLRQMLSKQWNVRKCYKMKRLVFFSCIFN